MELTREAIINWLKTQPKDRTMGSPDDYDCSCLVACYLHDQGYPDASVGMDTVWFNGDRDKKGTAVSDDVRELIWAFDRIVGYNHTAAEVLEALKSNRAR